MQSPATVSGGEFGFAGDFVENIQNQQVRSFV
jgi:hypothetical protein